MPTSSHAVPTQTASPIQKRESFPDLGGLQKPMGEHTVIERRMKQQAPLRVNCQALYSMRLLRGETDGYSIHYTEGTENCF